MFTLTTILEPVPSYESLGCFRASAKKKPKALQINYMNFANQGNKKKQTTIDQCARIARAKGYTVFAVQNTAECWSDEDAQNRYDMLGPSGKCNDGVGLKGTNMVYRLIGKNIRLFYSSCLLDSDVTFSH